MPWDWAGNCHWRSHVEEVILYQLWNTWMDRNLVYWHQTSLRGAYSRAYGMRFSRKVGVVLGLSRDQVCRLSAWSVFHYSEHQWGWARVSPLPPKIIAVRSMTTQGGGWQDAFPFFLFIKAIVLPVPAQSERGHPLLRSSVSCLCPETTPSTHCRETDRHWATAEGHGAEKIAFLP